MSRYRRADTKGATYFVTAVTCRRQPILCDEPVRTALREAINKIRTKHPYTIDAWVLLPDHLHCLWTLPPGDSDFSARWAQIKRAVSMACGEQYLEKSLLTPSKIKHRESTLWQRRFWEHRIRSEIDYARHVDYIHYNPVKHTLCRQPADWPYSTFHRHVLAGTYPPDWGAQASMIEGEFGE